VWDAKRESISAIEELYGRLLQATRKDQSVEADLEKDDDFIDYSIGNRSITVRHKEGHTLQLPLAAAVDKLVIQAGASHKMTIESQAGEDDVFLSVRIS
jgi:hypothetical protein